MIVLALMMMFGLAAQVVAYGVLEDSMKLGTRGLWLAEMLAFAVSMIVVEFHAFG